MRSFSHFNAESVKEACKLLAEYDGRAVLNAGGTDLLGTLKGENLFEYPESLINIKTISGLDKIVESKGTLRIGALAKLSALVISPLLNERFAPIQLSMLRFPTIMAASFSVRDPSGRFFASFP